MTAQTSERRQLLIEVVEHDRAIWRPEATTEQIGLRNRAARAALDSGVTAEEVATAVKVKPEDVQRWVAMRVS